MTHENNAVVAIYATHTEAESAIKELQKSGFDMKNLSIIGRDYHTEENVVGFYNTGDRMRYWGVTGAFWGGIWGLLFGSALFMVPGIGPIVVAGPLVAWIVAALESAIFVGGVSAVGAALCSIGIPRDSVLNYESGISIGKFLVVAHGSTKEVNLARATIEPTRPHSLDYYEFSQDAHLAAGKL